MRKKNVNQSGMRRMVFNGLTILFLLASGSIAVTTWGLLTKRVLPPIAWQPQVTDIPTHAVLPSDTPTSIPPTITSTLTPTITPIPKFTQQPATPTNLPITDTPTATLPSLPTVIVLVANPTVTPFPLPTITVLPTVEVTVSATNSIVKKPTITATAVYPFIIEAAEITFTKYIQGCNFQGISGRVYGMDNRRLDKGLPIQAMITKRGFNKIVDVENDPNYGWLLQVDETPQADKFTVWLQNKEGLILSDKATIIFPGNCDNNLAVVKFYQRKPY